MQNNDEDALRHLSAPDAALRITAVQYFAVRPTSWPGDMVNRLSDMAKRDPSPDVRAEAQRALKLARASDPAASPPSFRQSTPPSSPESARQVHAPGEAPVVRERV